MDVKILATVKEDVKVLGSRMDGYDKRLAAIEKNIADRNVAEYVDEKQSKFKNKKFIKCDSCEREKKWCTHCSRCGDGDHKRKLYKK